ncbi:unnamed protein product [Symbiodinium sp. KB8]|nr:unnamed protein product [Symbiodinium sp. KB8]
MALGKDLRVFVLSLRSTFGDRFLGYLLLNYLCLKGITLTLLQTSMLPYLQHMGVKGVEFQLASMVAMIPWSMKGFIGVLSDIVPLGRYHKRGYLLLSVALGLFGISMLSFRPESRDESSLWFTAALFACAFAFLATFDLLCEGKYSEIMREEQVLSLVWSCMQLGSLVAALGVADVVDTEGPRPLIRVCLFFTLLSLWRTCAGDLPEEPARSWRSLWAKAMSEPGLFLLASAMAAGSAMVAFATAIFGDQGRVLTALGVSALMVIFSFKTLPRVLARRTETCVEDGPHFTYAYYLAISNVVGAVGSILGAVIFQYMQDWTFRQAFWVTTVIQVVASWFDLLIISRYNLKFGFSDRAAYLFGDAIVEIPTSPVRLVAWVVVDLGVRRLVHLPRAGGVVEGWFRWHHDGIDTFDTGLDAPPPFTDCQRAFRHWQRAQLLAVSKALDELRADEIVAFVSARRSRRRMRGATDPRAPRSETIQAFVCRSQPDDNLLSRVHGSARARGRGRRGIGVRAGAVVRRASAGKRCFPCLCQHRRP